MKQELQDNIGFRDLTCLMTGKLSHKITVPDIVLDQFRAVITTTQQFNHLACFIEIFRMKRTTIPKILSHKKRCYKTIVILAK